MFTDRSELVVVKDTMGPSWDTFRHKVTIVFVTLAFILFLFPLFTIILILSLVGRLLASLLAKVLRPDLSHIVGGKTAPLMALELIEDCSKFNILTLLVLEEELSVDEFRRSFEARVLKLDDTIGGSQDNQRYRLLRHSCTQFLGYLFWKLDVNFNLANHIREYDYSRAGLKLPFTATWKDIEAVAGELIVEPWPEGTSPWEILFITCSTDAKDSSKQFTVLAFRIHHALADGFSILEMICRAGDVQNLKVPKASFPILSAWQKLVRLLVVGVRMPYDLVKGFVDAHDGPNSWNLLGTGKGFEGEYLMFFSHRILVDRIKEIRKKYGVGFNVAVYAVAIGVVRRMMIRAGQRVPERMGCYVPLPLPDHPGGLTVHVSYFLFRFSPGIETAAGRMTETANIFNALHNTPNVPIVNSFAEDCVALLPVCILRALRDKLFKVSIAMTNFPGPDAPLTYLRKARVRDMVFAVGLPPGTGAVTSMLSSQRIVFTIDKKIFEGYHVPHDFAQLINEEVEDLLGATDDFGSVTQ